jgi:hypothetical protein
MADGDAVWVGDRNAESTVRAGSGEGGQVAAQVRVENTEPVSFAGSFREPEQHGQRENQVSQDRTAS